MDQVRASPPNTVYPELVLVDSQLAPEVRPVLVAKAAAANVQ